MASHISAAEAELKKEKMKATIAYLQTLSLAHLAEVFEREQINLEILALASYVLRPPQPPPQGRGQDSVLNGRRHNVD